MQRIKIFCLLFLFSAMAFSQSVTLSKNATVSVLTCGTGPEVYALFGHTAIRIKDPDNGLDIVYNYGAFDFSTPNFALKFVKGDMQYFVVSDSFNDFISEYHEEKRSVWEQVLNIPLEKKQELLEKLNAVLFSDARFYTYKFIDRNCTNMASDLLNKTLGENVIFKRKDTGITYRKILYPYFNGHFYEQLGTSIIFGTKVDRKAKVLFLPIELQQSLAKATYNGQPLAPKNRILMEYKPENPGSWWNNIYTYLLFLALVVAANKNWLTLFYLMIIAALGLFFSIAGWYSLHEELALNYNILLFNPAVLLLVYFYARNNQKWVYRVSLFCLFSIGFYLVIMLNKVDLLIVMPIVAANIILLGRFALRSRNQMMAAG